MRIISLIAATALACCMLFSATAMAMDIVNGPSTENLGGFFANLQYEPVPDSAGTMAILTVTITNITDPALGGFITGFALNNPGGLIHKVEAGPDFAPGFVLMGATPKNTVKCSPYGFFDFGAALGGNFLGGGSPRAGIAVDSTQTFTFILTGEDLDRLDPYSFRDEHSALNKQDNASGFFVVRFKGFVNGGSDKALSLGWMAD